MKPTDIEKIHEAGLITAEQRDKIIAHFNLKEDSNRFLVIVSFLGAVLVATGIILLIAANWADIPRGVKIAAGLALMLGAHGAGLVAAGGAQRLSQDWRGAALCRLAVVPRQHRAC